MSASYGDSLLLKIEFRKLDEVGAKADFYPYLAVQRRSLPAQQGIAQRVKRKLGL